MCNPIKGQRTFLGRGYLFHPVVLSEMLTEQEPRTWGTSWGGGAVEAALGAICVGVGG